MWFLLNIYIYIFFFFCLLFYSFSGAWCFYLLHTAFARQAQIASAAALVVMLDRTTSISLQIAEYKDPTKCGSFMPLSISLGQILMQLHTGTQYTVPPPCDKKQALSIKRLDSTRDPGSA